jgi:hypothetical protein
LTDSSPPRGRGRARGGLREVRTLDVVRTLTRILKSANMRHTIIHLEVLRVDITKFQLRASHEPKVF